MSRVAAYTLTPEIVRRLAIYKQRLVGQRPAATHSGILDLVRDLGCLQLDPISAVARSHTLVLWSRVGNYDLGELNRLLWEDRQLFEYWAHAASIVLSEDYPIHQVMMQNYSVGTSPWVISVREWIESNRALHDYVLGEITRRGPVASRELEEAGKDPNGWVSTGWTSGRNISRMLDFLWMQGVIAVAGRGGGQKLWDLSERHLAQWQGLEPLHEDEAVYRAAQKSLRALGVARPQHIKVHYIRNRYPTLKQTLARLEKEGRILPVLVEDGGNALPGPWYVHADDAPIVDRLLAGEWEARTTLLSPFDNLICDRTRTELLFDFNYRIEIYVPKDKRKYGYYVLPILHGDKLIGRIDPTMNRKEKKLTINAVYAEEGAPAGAGKAVRRAIEELGTWLGAHEVEYGERAPEIWRKALRA
jgi:uncharacterized protein YcaQ